MHIQTSFCSSHLASVHINQEALASIYVPNPAQLTHYVVLGWHAQFGQPANLKLTNDGRGSYCQRPGLSVGQAARLPNTPNRPLRPPDKGQTGIDWPPMVNLKGQTGASALLWVATSIAILRVTTSASNSKKSYYNKVNLEQ
jgi:hypothetical protein